MSWRESLQEASFRGVGFHVESDDSSFGRRVEVHEYPQRDKPNAEDLGRKAREVSLIGYVIGDDYMAKRDALLAAIEKAGAGELVHPYYGRMQVTATLTRVSHSFQEGGMCRFQLSFVEAGEIVFPAAVNATSTQALLAVDQLETTCIADFSEQFSVDNLSDFAVQDAATQWTDALDTIEQSLGNAGLILSNPLALLKENLVGLLYTPAALASQFLSILSKADAVLTAASGLGDIHLINVMNVLTGLDLISQFNQVFSDSSTPTMRQVTTNRAAVQTLIRGGLIAQTAGMVATMPLPVFEDAMHIKDALLSVIDTEMATANDSSYLSLSNLRTKIYADINARTQNAARLQNLTPKEVMPALVLAYDLYEDVAREQEIVARNKVRHPGFVPVTILKVLSA